LRVIAAFGCVVCQAGGYSGHADAEESTHAA
jgi:hypothetical protein